MADEKNNIDELDARSMGMNALTQGLQEAGAQMGVDPSSYQSQDGGFSGGEHLKSSFKSMDLGNSGKVLGITLDPGTANIVDALLYQALPETIDYASKHATHVAQKFAENFLGKNAIESLNFGKTYGRAVPYGILFARPAVELGVTAYNTSHKLFELRQALSIINKANDKLDFTAGIFSNANNEVVHNARQKVFAATKNELLKNVSTNAIALAPEFIRLRSTEASRIGKEISEAEFEHLKKHGTPDEIKEYNKERLKKALNTGSEGRDMLNEQKKIQQKEYDDGFKEFKNKNRGKAMDAIEHAKDDDELKKFVEKLDLNISKPDIEDSDHLEKIEERWLKYQYAKENGAWNEDWISSKDKKSLRKDGGKVETHVSLLEDIYRKEVDRINGVNTDVNHKDGPSDASVKKTVNNVVQGLFTIAAKTVGNIVTSATNQELKEEQALDMILNFRRALDNNAQRDMIPGGKESNKNEEYSFALYVHKIFKENQRDSGLAEIGDRYTSHLRSANWSDEAIQKMKDSDLNPYEVVIKHVSQYIHMGRMDALALINLVGERKIVQKSGKSFGLMQGGTDEDVKSALLKEVDKQAALLKPHHKMDEAEVSEALGHYSFSKEELQAAFASSSKLDSEAKEFLFTLVDMNTPDHDVVKDLTGLSDSQIKTMRATSQEKFTREFDAALREIAQDIQQSPKTATTKYNLSEEQVNHFIGLSRQAEQTDATLDGLLTNGNRKQIAASVASVMIDDSTKHNSSFWRDKIKPHAHETKQRNNAEAAMKQQEKDNIENEDFGSQEEHFADKVVSNAADKAITAAKDYSNGYMDSLPVVTKEIQEHFSNPALASQATKAAANTIGNQLGASA